MLTTHLTEVIKDNLAELLSYAETQKLLDELSRDYQKLIEDLVPNRISVGGIQRVLQGLLAERISIRDLAQIVEAIGETVGSSQNAMVELEYSELGRCQIDVLCQARRFDLLVRTEESLRPHLRRDLRELYLAAREAAGLVGEIRFRAGGLVALPGPIGAGGAGGGVTV